MYGRGIQIKIAAPNTLYKCLECNTQTQLTRTNYCCTHAIIRTFNTIRNHFLLSRRGQKIWQICACVWEREKERGSGREKESEMQRHRHWDRGGRVHTERLLINRVTVMIPPNVENVNTFFSIHLSGTQGTSSATKSPPTQTCWAADTQYQSPCHTIRHSTATETTATLCACACVYVCVTPQNHVILWAWDFLSTCPPDEISPHLSQSVSDSLSPHFEASKVIELVAKICLLPKPYFYCFCLRCGPPHCCLHWGKLH